MKEGIHTIPFDEYKAAPGLNPSTLKPGAGNGTMAAVKYKMDNPPEQTDAMRVSSAIHCAFLEPAEFDRRYCVLPEGLEWGGKAKKRAAIDALSEIASAENLVDYLHDPTDFRKDEILATWSRINNISPISAKEMSLIRAAQKSLEAYLKEDEAFREIWTSPRRAIEQALFWEEEIHGVQTLCKTRPDFLILPAQPVGGSAHIIDLKAYRSPISQHVCQQRFFSDAMHIQFGMAAMALEELRGIEEIYAAVLWIDKGTPPHLCRCDWVDERSLEKGKNEARELIHRFNECKASGKWPGHTKGGVITVPRYLEFDADDETEESE